MSQNPVLVSFGPTALLPDRTDRQKWITSEQPTIGSLVVSKSLLPWKIIL